MLPLHAQGYLSGCSASAGFLQILHTSSSSSSSSNFADAKNGVDDDDANAFDSFSGEEEEDNDDATTALTLSDETASSSGPGPSIGGATGAISMASRRRFGLMSRLVSWRRSKPGGFRSLGNVQGFFFLFPFPFLGGTFLRRWKEEELVNFVFR